MKQPPRNKAPPRPDSAAKNSSGRDRKTRRGGEDEDSKKVSHYDPSGRWTDQPEENLPRKGNDTGQCTPASPDRISALFSTSHVLKSPSAMKALASPVADDGAIQIDIVMEGGESMPPRRNLVVISNLQQALAQYSPAGSRSNRGCLKTHPAACCKPTEGDCYVYDI